MGDGREQSAVYLLIACRSVRCSGNSDWSLAVGFREFLR